MPTPTIFVPKIITARQLGLRFANVFGELGPELHVTGHHSAGPKDSSLAELLRLVRQYHADHASKGWGGLGYHYVLGRRGEIVCARPTILLGAHVGLHNTSNIGVMSNGTTGDRPTLAQRLAFKWLLEHAHTSKLPERHRTDRRLTRAQLHGHNDWSGHEANACPGTHKRMYLSGGKSR